MQSNFTAQKLVQGEYIIFKEPFHENTKPIFAQNLRTMPTYRRIKVIESAGRKLKKQSFFSCVFVDFVRRHFNDYDLWSVTKDNV